MSTLFQEAIKSWQNILGETYVNVEKAQLDDIATTTFLTTWKVIAILQPGSTREVQSCVEIANRYKIPIYPVSAGKNWGNGSSVPAADKCVVMQLRRMNKISELNLKQACVTIEPGVTQSQLANFLKESNSGLWVDITGAGPDTSLIGNIMERGVGYSPYSNRVSHICNIEVVLPNGDLIVTGFGKYSNAVASSVYPWGVGPSLDGLFTQSNLGIITRLTLWLMPEPEKIECFYFTIRGEDKLQDVVDALQPLRLRRILQSAIHIGNNYKVINTYFQYPWELSNGQTPLPSNSLKILSKSVGCEDWGGSGALYGTPAQIKESKRLLNKALKGKVHRLSFMNDTQLRIAKIFPGILGKILNIDLKSMLPAIESIYGMQKGIPSDITMSSIYWRKKTHPPKLKDPDRDRCGLIWYSPVAPLDGAHAAKIYSTAKEIMLSYSFEPLMAFVLMSERALCGVAAIVFDRDTPGEDARALQCHYDLITTLSNLGYYPYRLGIQNMTKLLPDNENYVRLINQLKKNLDPNNILAPGRYEI